MITAKYGGETLPIVITKVSRYLLPSMTNTVQNYGVDGVKVINSYHSGSKVVIEFNIKQFTINQLHDARDSLARILRNNNGGKLEISDRPYEYYNAFLDGEQTLEFDWEYLMDNIGKITFLVPDGKSHGSELKQFPFMRMSDGSYQSIVINSGTESVPISVRVNLKKESGFLGVVSKYGVMQFGKPEEADLEERTKSVRLLKNSGGNFSDWNQGIIFFENQSKKSVTSMSSWNSFGGWEGVLPRTFSNSLNASYYGAIIEKELPETAKDWYIWARAWFETGRMGQTGAWALTVIDEDNHLIAGMVLEKYDRVGNTALCSFLMGDNGGSLVKKTIQFIPHYWIDRNNSNPYGSQSRDQNRNMFDLKKENEKITYYWYGGYYSYTSQQLSSKKAKKVQFFVGQMAGRDTSENQFVTHHYLSDFSFTKLNVPYWVDVPNRFPSGAELYVDGEKGKFYVNNLLSLNDEIKGTKYFNVPPGETTISLVVSSFSEIDSAWVEIKEAKV